MSLVFASIGWLVGLWLGLVAIGGMRIGAPEGTMPLPSETGMQLGALAALMALVALLGRDAPQLRTVALSVGFGLLGCWRALSMVPEADPLLAWIGPVTVQGTVAGRPEPRDTALHLVLDVEQLQRKDSWESVRGRLLVRTDRYEDWAYGDRVVAGGNLRAVGGGYWAEHLARQRIHTTLEYPRMSLEDRAGDVDPRRWIDNVRGGLESLCARLLPEPQASLLAGILVGTRADMPVDFRDALNATSTSHIVAVSGFNVTVVAGVAQLVALRFLARRKATLLAMLLVWLYALLTGLPPSALRAAIMASLALSAVLVGRGGDALSFLCLSGALMAGLDPLLLYDLGFQLSFLATAGLVLLEPVLRGCLVRLPGWLAGSLSVTLAAQLATVPVLVFNFHTLALISPLSNVLIAPVLPATMGAGTVALALGAVSEPIGQMAAIPAWLPLTYLVEVIRWTARLPGAAVPTGDLGFGPVALYLLLLLSVALWPLPEMRRARETAAALAGGSLRWVAAAAVAAILSLLVVGFSGRPDGRVHVYFLDVGHGDAALIRGPQGHFVLVDGGPSPTSVISALGRHLPFLDRRLDAVLLTGYGDDRLAGLLEVARRHPLGLVLQPGAPGGQGASRAWAGLVRERGLPAMELMVGQRIALGEDVWLEVVWAPSGGSPEESGAALKLNAGGVVVLLPGDLSRAAQVEMARASPGRVDVLRVARQGAAGTLDQRLLQAMSPRVAVLSAKAGNRFGHPAESTLEMLRGATLFRTDHHGTVEVVIDRGGYAVLTER